MEKENEGFIKLYKTLAGIYPSTSLLPYDEDAEFIAVLPHLEYLNLTDFDIDTFDNQIKLRSRVRYLAALFPDDNLITLSNKIHGIINNSNLEVDKLRLIIAGKKLSNPSEDTHEIRLRIIQGIGKCLRDGLSMRETAREMSVADDTVKAIETYTGISKAYKSRLMDKAINAVRDGISIRAFAKANNISRTQASNLMSRGHKVLAEIGETK